jgi:hypothetical protein
LVGVTARRILGCGPQTRADRGGRSRGHHGTGKRGFLLVSLSVAMVVGIFIIIVGI